MIDPYLAQRADFTRKFANSANQSIRFSRPRMTLVWKTSAFRSPQTAPPHRAHMPVNHRLLDIARKTRHAGRVRSGSR